jgi:hypothetical protein
MSEITNKFVENMLKSAKDKKKVEPQTRTEGVNRDDMDQIMKDIREKIQKKK